MLRCWVAFPGKELGGAIPPAGGLAASTRDCYKTNTECNFCFLPFSVKAKILFRFLLVSKNRYQCRCFIKATWCKQTFKKWGMPVPDYQSSTYLNHGMLHCIFSKRYSVIILLSAWYCAWHIFKASNRWLLLFACCIAAITTTYICFPIQINHYYP